MTLLGDDRWRVVCADCLDWLPGLPERCVDLVFTSPPYEGQRTYGLGFRLTGQAWVDWMRRVVVAAARVSAGLVVVNACCPVRRHAYSPALEWLVSDLTRIDGLVCGPSPYAWVKSADDPHAYPAGIPGSGGKRYHRRDWEPLYTFCLPDRLPLCWSDNTAFGHPPLCAPGGSMSNRMANGTRVGDSRTGGRHTKRAATADGDIRREQHYTAPLLSNPGNVIRARVGGASLGSSAAHKSEAPMNMLVAERFVCWFCPPAGLVLDPFVGSGTTVHAALTHGRRGIGCDLRESQCEIARLRLGSVTPSMFDEV